jgi:hypothetical protein
MFQSCPRTTFARRSRFGDRTVRLRSVAARGYTVEQEQIVPVLRFLRSVLLRNVAVFVACAALVWFGGWRTLYDYGNALVIAGAAIVCVGAASALSGWGLTRTPEYWQGQTASSEKMTELTRRAQEDMRESYGFMLRMVITGAVPILAGILIHTLLA